MKFRFCGDSDCPDWVLSEIHSTLSVLSAIKLRILVQAVAKSINENVINNEEKIMEMISSANDDGKSAKSAIACVRYILMNASIYKADETTLNTELQQLGLPKEHSNVLCRIHGEYVAQIQIKNLNNKFILNELESIKGEISKNAIDCGLLQLKINNDVFSYIGNQENTTHNINIHKSDVSILLGELREIKRLMENC